MKNLVEKLKPILKKQGVFYPAPIEGKGKTDCTIILEDHNGKVNVLTEYLANKGRVRGFTAYHKLTGDSYIHSTLVSKKIGNPGIYVILEANEMLEECEPVEYGKNFDEALEKAYAHLFNEIVYRMFHPDDVYTNLLDKTKIGLEKFQKEQKVEQNKANLSANKQTKSLVDFEKYAGLERGFG